MSDGRPTAQLASQMALALTQLHDSLQDLRLPLALPDVEELRRIRPYISFPGQVVPTR